jgi:hypothetical protein
VAIALIFAGCTSEDPASNAGFGAFGGTGGSSPPAGGTGGGSAPHAMPCEVETIVKSNCQSCHGSQLIGGAPMSLMTVEDFQRDYVLKTTPGFIGQTMKVYAISKMRVNRLNGTGAMPQGRAMLDTDTATLNAWLDSGAPAGSACAQPVGGAAGMAGVGGGDIGGIGGIGGTTAGTGGMNPTGGTGGTGGSGGDGTPTGYRAVNRCSGESAAEAFQPLTPRDGEICYEFLAHENSSPTDTAKFTVPHDESYNQFYYDIPWPAGTVATRFGARFDNLQVLHHWLGFTSTSPNPTGTVARDVTGTTLGESSELVGGWAVGGCNTEFPADVGLVLPDTGRIMIQWHHYNTTGAPQADGSAVQWCTVPAAMRAHAAGITFLGTENFNGPFGMPPGVQSEFSTGCANNTAAPITIIGFNPHMHLLGVNMKSAVQRVNGMLETVFDEPFVFDQQVNYDMDPFVVLQPGDRIDTTCTFNNTTTGAVAFGQSTSQEMCYQFAVAYPYGALNNGVISLIGATNTCW